MRERRRNNPEERVRWKRKENEERREKEEAREYFCYWRTRSVNRDEGSVL